MTTLGRAQEAVPSAEDMVEQVATATVEGLPAKVVVIPVQDQIAKPILYVIRRGLKQAIEMEADLVVLDMKTPGGSLGVTFEIMEALDRFKGETATYVNNEAISAGAFISAMTDDIYFATDGVIGAAAPVSGGGADIDETMKQKIVSYLKARIRAISEGHPYRGEVISAMIDANYELKIGDEVLKEKGELLSLTASEAAETYGDPAQPLLSAGTAESIDALLSERFGERAYTTLSLETTWSEELAAWLNAISPLLMGLGLLGVFIEFKTPGFGVFGIAGGAMLAVVFFGHYVAGLSGHEPALFFAIGAMLVLVELLFLPGTIFIALAGVVSMLGSLLWSMADIWPDEPISFSGDTFTGPLIDLSLALTVTIVGAILVVRFMPRGWVWDKLVIAASITGTSGAPVVAGAPAAGSLVGQTGVAATDLFPSGQVEVGGKRYEAKLVVGSAEAGATVVVRRETGFGLEVEALAEDDV
ncbi:NfeD family protein [Actomonas aquatica]|uniref:NfeD-like C-terminal domain-containing protein n=1 Tax=Actomonas aquatica TaxID=2866162 RepID=A0ABZ1CEH9_9BACT|nr:hypothetical protein [Opitutus sp. WL0086]WRQ89851.1 hypothetical protein K1X11_010580 [Opitutus sp. WL0086]